MDWFDAIYKKQMEFQKFLLNKENIEPNPVTMYHSATAAMVEIGEMLQEDTRWKNAMGSVRPATYNPDEFKKEFADVFIFLLNVLMYSGISSEEIKNVIKTKIDINWSRKL